MLALRTSSYIIFDVKTAIFAFIALFDDELTRKYPA
jgi:hypothetical protein